MIISVFIIIKSVFFYINGLLDAMFLLKFVGPCAKLHRIHFCAILGPSINDVTHLGGRPFVTKCDEGMGCLRNVTSHQNAQLEIKT